MQLSELFVSLNVHLKIMGGPVEYEGQRLVANLIGEAAAIVLDVS